MSEQFSTYYQSPLGLIHLSGTEEYITEISFIDTVQHPPAVNQSALPTVILQAVEELIQYFQGQRLEFSFPMNQNGTEFQQRVWGELMHISFGKTISYLELSRRLV